MPNQEMSPAESQAESLAESVATFIRDPAGQDTGSHDFDDLTRRAFAFQYERSKRYRQLCQLHDAEPGSIRSWRDVPAIAAKACQNFFVDGTAEPGSLHRGLPERLHRSLQNAMLDASWPRFCLGQLTQPSILSLLPSTEQAPDAMLAVMVDDVLERWGHSDSVVAVGNQGVSAKKARGFLAARQRDARPILVLATARTLEQLVESLEKLDLRFRLPAASVLVEIGASVGPVIGTGARTGENHDPSQLHNLVEQFLAIPPTQIVREHGSIELASQLFTDTLDGGDPEVFMPPHWVRLSIVDPDSKQEAVEGEPGNLCVFDLANLGSAIHIDTRMRGTAHAGGFRPLGLD